MITTYSHRHPENQTMFCYAEKLHHHATHLVSCLNTSVLNMKEVCSFEIFARQPAGIRCRHQNPELMNTCEILKSVHVTFFIKANLKRMSNLIFVVPCIMLNSEINPTRCNNCVYSSQTQHPEAQHGITRQ